MKEKTLLKIILLLLIMIIILLVISVVTYAEVGNYTEFQHNYADLTNYRVRYLLPGQTIELNTQRDYENMLKKTYDCIITFDKRINADSSIPLEEKRGHRNTRGYELIQDQNYFGDNIISLSYTSQSQNSFGIYVYQAPGINPGQYIFETSITNMSSQYIMMFCISNNSIGDFSVGGYQTYSEALNAYNALPKLYSEFESGNSYKPYTYNSVRFNVNGSNLPVGNFNISLHKMVDNVKTRVSTIYSGANENTEVSKVYDCGSLEIGSYVIDVMFTYEDIESGLQKVITRQLDFVITDEGSENDRYPISIGGQYILVDRYYNQIWKLEYPSKNLLYNVVPQLKFKGNEIYISKSGLLQYWNYNSKFLYNSMLWDIFGEHYPKVNIYLNDHLIDTVNFSTIADLNFNYTIPESKLNRGLNTIYITSFNHLIYSDDRVDFYKDGGYRYLFSGVDFYYKSSEGGNPDNPPDEDLGPGGIDWGEVPNRSEYREDWIGDIQYGIDYLAYLISLPFKVIFGGIEYLVSNFSNMFSWVGSLTEMIGTWFGFLPSEIRLLILGVIVCSFVGFAISIFKK